MGMGGNDSSVQISSNDIFANNVEEYKHSWSAGGMKLSNGNTLVIDGNHNHGNGVWTHVPNSPQNITISNNRVDHNEDHGICFEVSTKADIYDNKVWENGWVGGGYGISLSASSGARVHHNTVAWNEGGITVHNPIRTDVPPEEGAYNTVGGVEVDHNDVLQQGGTASRRFRSRTKRGASSGSPTGSRLPRKEGSLLNAETPLRSVVFHRTPREVLFAECKL
jgi:parallel beta-helix repeat protein